MIAVMAPESFSMSLRLNKYIPLSTDIFSSKTSGGEAVASYSIISLD